MTETEGLARINACRQRIDELDVQITRMLNERAKAASEIGRVKRHFNMPVYAPKREEMVYANVFAQNAGPLTNDALRRVYERIIDEMRNLEKQEIQAEGGAR